MSEVLIRAADAGATYVATTWLDPDEVTLAYEVVAREAIDPLLVEIRSALMSPLEGETELEAATRALKAGTFTDRDRVADLGTRLGAVLLPRASTTHGHTQRSFWEELYEREPHGPVTVRITPSRTTAVVPWELLRGPDGRTLLETAAIVYEVPSVALSDRAMNPTTYVAEPFSPTAPALYTIDPNTGRSGLGPALDYRAGRPDLLTRLGIEHHSRVLSREDLSHALRAEPRPGRWLYFGHVSSRHDQPGSASLHLSDTASVVGTAEVMSEDHRPLTALDLVLGTSEHTSTPAGMRLPGEPGRQGIDLWPMPARVAFIACESGADHASTETFGLVVAALSNGAHHVTSTRWTMPTDHAFQQLGGTTSAPTSELTLAVDRAQRTTDPVAALQHWQRARHARWLTTGALENTPLLYAGVTTHHAHVHRQTRR